MEVVNRLLLSGGDALLALWGLIKACFSGGWAAVETVLNPVLSPLLAALNPVCTGIGDAVYAVLSPLPVWSGLTILSILTGIVMLIAFRYTSNQDAIGRAKDDIKANLLALKLYKDELSVTFRAQWRLLRAIVRLQRYVLVPVLIMLGPMLLGLAQMGIRYQWRPLRPGEGALVKMKLSERVVNAADVRLEPCAGLTVEVGPVPGGGEVAWRVRAAKAGRHTLRFHVGDHPIEKELVVGEQFQRVSALRVGADWVGQLLHPAERRLASGDPVESLEILYPGADSVIYGANWWVLHFFVVSMLTALLLKPVFRVRF
jgi:hypothetical protein